MLKYKILALDHDDTVVKSTAEVHYPAFLETLKALRPEISMSLETFNEYCFSPGFFPLCREILKLTDKEMVLQDGIWKNYARTHRPNCLAAGRAFCVTTAQMAASSASSPTPIESLSCAITRLISALRRWLFSTGVWARRNASPIPIPLRKCAAVLR